MSALAVTGAVLDGGTVGVRCEVEDCVAEHGVRPAAYLDRLGLLGERTVLAHGVWLDEAELETIATRGGTVVAGRVLVRGGEVEGTAEILARARERADRLGIGQGRV